MDTEKPLKNLTSALQFVGASVFIFYLIGYIVVNSYYVKNGFFSYDIFSIQILSAGILFSLIYGIYGFVVGRRLYHLKSDKDNFIEMGANYCWPLLWRDFISIFVFVEVLFAILVSVYWTSIILFDVTDKFKNFAYILTVAFLFDYFVLWRRGLYKRKPHIALPAAFVVFCLVILYGIKQIDSIPIILLIAHYIIFSLLLYFVIDTHRRSNSSPVFTAFWTLITVATFTVSLGSTYYGSIKSEMGGGEPRTVKIILNISNSNLNSLLVGKDSKPKKVHILGESSTELFIDLDTGKEIQPLRVSKTAILAIQPIIDIEDNTNKTLTSNSTVQ